LRPNCGYPGRRSPQRHSSSRFQTGEHSADESRSRATLTLVSPELNPVAGFGDVSTETRDHYGKGGHVWRADVRQHASAVVCLHFEALLFSTSYFQLAAALVLWEVLISPAMLSAKSTAAPLPIGHY
jgi:hypothetical protein